MRRVQMMSAVMAFALSPLVTLAASASASASASAKAGTVTCGHMSKGGTLTDCSDYANTGGSGQFSLSNLVTGKFVVHWATGKATSVGDEVQLELGAGCKISYALYVMQGNVLKDQTGSIDGPASASMCDSPNGFKLRGQFVI